ncbi:TetR/AcrR family transcriptional regulator [Paraflavitalea speifideaquila]|uniref:TetR/AcrR family transcriptional regulator n=1 Tax=Paraflavitalea speifideaquila TaxID=3076558 RepID=UPI0028E9C411|nr:TetR/AcrR family transcriptional regulator [Paraflavitalea speifideiaquila]
MWNRGLAGARMQDIADRAGINKALLHYYFRSKDKLFDMIFQEAAGKFLPRVSVLFDSDIPFNDKIRAFVTNYMGLLMDNPFLPLFVLNEVHKNPEEFIIKIWGGKMPPIAEFIKQMDKEVKAGRIRPVNPMHLMLHMISMCVYPFVAKSIVTSVFKANDKQFMLMMEERKTEVADFIIHSLRP